MNLRNALVLCGVCVLSIGCGNRTFYPVEGKVLDPDGKPIPELRGSTIEFESLEAKMSATGEIEEDGRFRLTTERPGDGAWRGRHKVLIARQYFDPDTAAPRVIDAKYEAFETSGLEAEVKREGNNFTFNVERVKKKKR